ncbi:DUF6924 domain-containing protein [Streptomyces sp. NPDC005262]|uniref:DUF6924 domain-containing protein n=1 Tax=Streptomyces sp. NPDC005262 TaxID=3364710 RepID=UPI0036A4E316
MLAAPEPREAVRLRGCGHRTDHLGTGTVTDTERVQPHSHSPPPGVTLSAKRGRARVTWRAVREWQRGSVTAVSVLHENLSIANVDFEDFAEVASADPEGVLRSDGRTGQRDEVPFSSDERGLRG